MIVVIGNLCVCVYVYTSLGSKLSIVRMDGFEIIKLMVRKKQETKKIRLNLFIKS